MCIADSRKIKKLINSNISGWNIEKNTGVSRTTITEIRQGKRQIKNIRLVNAIKLTSFANKKFNDTTSPQ